MSPDSCKLPWFISSLQVRANALGMDIVETGRFAQILGRVDTFGQRCAPAPAPQQSLTHWRQWRKNCWRCIDGCWEPAERYIWLHPDTRHSQTARQARGNLHSSTAPRSDPRTPGPPGCCLNPELGGLGRSKPYFTPPTSPQAPWPAVAPAPPHLPADPVGICISAGCA